MFTQARLFLNCWASALTVIAGLALIPGVVAGGVANTGDGPPADTPEAGDDSFDSSANLSLNLGLGGDVTVKVAGPVSVGRGKAFLNGDDLWEIPTIMKTGCLGGTLPGLGDIQIQIEPSKGKIIQTEEAKAKGAFFPADSFFDIEFGMVVDGVEYTPFEGTADPCKDRGATVRMEAVIDVVPPCGTAYQTTVAVDLLMYDCWTGELFTVTVMEHLSHEVVACPPDITLPPPSREEHCSTIRVQGRASVSEDAGGEVCLTLALDRPGVAPCETVIVTTGPVAVANGQTPEQTARALCRALQRALDEHDCNCTVRCFGPFIEICCRTHVRDLVCCLTGTDIPAPGLTLGSPLTNLGQVFVKRAKIRRIPWQAHVNQDTDAVVVIDIPGILDATEVALRGPSQVAIGGQGENPDTIQTEMVKLSLTSMEPVQVGGGLFDVYLTLDDQPSTGGGFVEPQQAGVPSVMFDSFFDIFTEISLIPREPGEIPPMRLRSHVRVAGGPGPVPIPGLPRPVKYLQVRNAAGQPVPHPLLEAATGDLVGAVLEVQHSVPIGIDKSTASPGDTVTIVGDLSLGFGDDPDDLCVLVNPGGGGDVIPLRARAAEQGQIVAEVGPIPPNQLEPGPLQIMRGAGQSDAGDPPTACAGLLAGTASWSWGPVGNPFCPDGPEMQGNPSDSPPGVVWYFGEQKDDKVCLPLPNEGWCPGAKVSITGRILSCPSPDEAGGGGGCKGYDFQHEGFGIDFGVAGGSPKECAELICCLIREKCRSLAENEPNALTGNVCCEVEDDPNNPGGVVIKLFIKDAQGSVCPLTVSSLAICIECPPAITPAPCGCQVPGDCNQDGNADLSDMVCLLGHVFSGQPPTLPCDIIMDCNGDGAIDISDAIWGLSFQFLGGPAPVLGTQCICLPDCPENSACPLPGATCLPPSTPPEDTPPAEPDTFNSAIQLSPVDDDGSPLAGGFLKFIGPVTVNKGDAFLNGDGRWVVPTEMVAMSLTGVSPAGGTLSLAPGTTGLGQVISQQGVGGPFFPADSYFDMEVLIDIPGLFSAVIPVHVEAEDQTEIPGCDCYRTGVNFHAENPDVGPNYTGGHAPCPPGCPPDKCSDDPNREPCPL